MCDQQNHRLWLTRGKQRHAAAISFTAMRSGAELLSLAKTHASKITARDLRAILREFEARGLIHCINPQDTCGRLFCPTPQGARLFEQLSGKAVVLPPDDLDFGLLAFLARGRVRRAVFLLLASEPLGKPKPRAASTLKRALRGHCPVTLNQTIRALNELQRAGLIQTVETGSRLHSYGLTQSGIRTAEFLTQSKAGKVSAGAAC